MTVRRRLYLIAWLITAVLAGAAPTGAQPRIPPEGIRAESAGQWDLRQRKGVGPYKSSDPDTERIWWTDAGVHQNLTFPVQPDPVSGSHCWHQKVRVARAEPQDRYGDIHVDTRASHEVFRRWLALTRPPKGGWRRPNWMLRPFRPDAQAYRLGESK